jgi:hypothetical protein
MASVLIAFPAFLWATRNVLRELSDSPEKVDSAVRRWLTNLALLVTALVFIGDLVSFLARFLGGGMTTPFALKSIVVAVLAGGVFLYYSRGLKKAGLERGWHRMFAWSAAILIGVSIALGFGVSGSPATLRLYTEDGRRLQAMYQIATEVALKGLATAPPELPALSAGTNDPITKLPFEYHLIGGTKYELCANFGIATHPSVEPGFWTHPAGQHCFTFDTKTTPPYPNDSYPSY